MTWFDRDAALAWAAGAGIELTGQPEQPHVRPWSTALRLPTSDGLVWLKAGAPGTAFEAGLVQALASYDVPHLLRPIAVHPERGWLLLPDGGRTLRTQLDSDPDPSHWERVLVRYAALQRSVEGRPLPAEDLTPQRMPLVLDELLDEVPVDPDLLPELRALRPRFAQWCAELDGCDVLPTVQHDDLHDNNVFAGRSDDLVYDWGDAHVGMPFGSLLVTLRSAARRWSLEPDDPVLRRLRDAYLDAWRDVHSRAELELLSLLATRVAKVGRVVAWQRALRAVPPEEQGEHREAAPGWLEELLEPDVF